MEIFRRTKASRQIAKTSEGVATMDRADDDLSLVASSSFSFNLSYVFYEYKTQICKGSPDALHKPRAIHLLPMS